MSRATRADLGPDWPHRERSRFLEVAGQRWHVQHWPPPRPDAPTWLLLHGTGAATHTWRDLAPRLAERVGLVAPDLPGHGFSGAAPIGRAGMEGMARAVRELLRELGVQPTVTVGHSAGAAIAVRMRLREDANAQDAQDARDARDAQAAHAAHSTHATHATPNTAAAAVLPAHTLVGLNAALLPLRGPAGWLFSPAAKLLALNPLAPHFFSWQVARGAVLDRVLKSTGSTIGAEGAALYRRLIENPAHLNGALVMMAQWDLPALQRDLSRLKTPLRLLVAEGDRTIPPADAERVRARLPQTQLHRVPRLGHLAHEEDPEGVAAWLLSLLPLRP